MPQNGHFQKSHRPTNLEVYNDAARILEELLDKQIGNGLHDPNKAKRNKTEPTSVKVVVHEKGHEKPIIRNKTMPSRSRGSKEEGSEKKEALKDQNKKNGSVSSADTEGDQSHDSEKRRKKSLFKRAKERLLHTFHRDQKEGFVKVPGKHSHESSPSKRRGHKKKAGGVRSEHMIGGEEACVNTDIESMKRERSSIFNSLRKRNKNLTDDQPSSKSVSITEPGSEAFLLNGTKIPASTPLATSSIPTSPSEDPPISEQVLPLPHQPEQRSPSFQSFSVNKNVKVVPDRTSPGTTSTSSSNLPVSELSSEKGSASNILQSLHSNVLDSPGEDIEFMDVDSSVADHLHATSNTNKSVQATGLKFHGSKDLLDMRWLAGQSTNNTQSVEVERYESHMSNVRPDGTATRVTEICQDGRPECEDEDDVDGIAETLQEQEPGKAEADKENLYGKIAQKLIEMGDLYSQSMSDQESHGAMAAAPTVPSDLEKEIIACLRTGGDRYSKQLDDTIEGLAESTKENAYQRFRSTIQNSMGSELNWNHLAFLFYTTKGVVSAVGKGSRVAVQTKEFTLQYISETFASWIMDQGGFDSMLSSSESDYDVD